MSTIFSLNIFTEIYMEFAVNSESRAERMAIF